MRCVLLLLFVVAVGCRCCCGGLVLLKVFVLTTLSFIHAGPCAPPYRRFPDPDAPRWFLTGTDQDSDTLPEVVRNALDGVGGPPPGGKL